MKSGNCSDHFFMSINRKAKSFSTFFTRQKMEKPILQDILRRVFQNEKIYLDVVPIVLLQYLV